MIVHCIYRGVTDYNLKKKMIIILSLKINFVLANSVDPDEMLHYPAFHLGLHCLPKYPFRSFESTKMLNTSCFKAAYSVTFDLLILELMFLFFNNTVK